MALDRLGKNPRRSQRFSKVKRGSPLGKQENRRRTFTLDRASQNSQKFAKLSAELLTPRPGEVANRFSCLQTRLAKLQIENLGKELEIWLANPFPGLRARLAAKEMNSRRHASSPPL
jgi:hypothetical protein